MKRARLLAAGILLAATAVSAAWALGVFHPEPVPVEPEVPLPPIGTMVYLPGASGIEFHTMANLMRQIPSYRLELGADISTIAPAVKEAIGRTSR